MKVREDTIITEKDPTRSFSVIVKSSRTFVSSSIVSRAILPTPDAGPLQGCVDEHARCPEWARGGLCLARPRFMGLTCRESCGTCGFLSPFNTEEQVITSLYYEIKCPVVIFH